MPLASRCLWNPRIPDRGPQDFKTSLPQTMCTQKRLNLYFLEGIPAHTSVSCGGAFSCLPFVVPGSCPFFSSGWKEKFWLVMKAVFTVIYLYTWASPMVQWWRVHLATQETQETGFDSWTGKTLEKEMTTHTSILAWKIPRKKESRVYGITKSWTWLNVHESLGSGMKRQGFL